MSPLYTWSCQGNGPYSALVAPWCHPMLREQPDQSSHSIDERFHSWQKLPRLLYQHLGPFLVHDINMVWRWSMSFWKMVKQMVTLTDYALFCNTIAKKFNKLWENYKDLTFTECVEKLTVWLITFSKLYRSLYQKQILYAQHDVIRSGLDCSCSACRLDDDTLTILLGRLVYHGLTILLGRLVYLVLSLFWRTFLDIECNFSVFDYI